VFRLLPREEKFFDLFEQQATHIVSASRVLEELTLDYADAKAKAQQIKDLEHAGDTVTHEIVRRLNTTFITPIDREDIYALASRLDDVLDLIDAVADRLLLYKIKAPTDGCIGMAKIIVKTAEETDRAVRCLRTLSPFYGRGKSPRERGGSPPARSARGPLRGWHRRHRGHQVERAVRDHGVGHRSVRGRGQRDRGYHPQDGLNRPVRRA
jgi:Protein of unknown function DUF47